MQNIHFGIITLSAFLPILITNVEVFKTNTSFLSYFSRVESNLKKSGLSDCSFSKLFRSDFVNFFS